MMINKRACVIGGIALFSAAFGQNIAQSSQHHPDEKFLMEARVVHVRKDTQLGRTELWEVDLEAEGINKRGIFKQVNRQRPHPLPDSYKYELAAYELNKLLGMDIVPPTVKRVIEEREGSLQAYLEGCIKETDRLRKKIQPPDDRYRMKLDDILLFESLTADECYDTDDIFLNTEDWSAWRIDFSEAFSPDNVLGEDCSILRCSRKIYTALLNLEEGQLEEHLSAYLNTQELAALWNRRDLIIKTIDRNIKKFGEEKVLH